MVRMRILQLDWNLKNKREVGEELKILRVDCNENDFHLNVRLWNDDIFIKYTFHSNNSFS